jgi:hypothetical protein
MNMRLDPTEYGLPARTVIEQIDKNTIALVIDRKSRIIMADGKKILEKLSKIKKYRPSVNVVLKTTAPVCSQSSQQNTRKIKMYVYKHYLVMISTLFLVFATLVNASNAPPQIMGN